MIATALLVALGVVLKAFLTIKTETNQLGFQLLTVYIAAIYFGPFYGMVTGGLLDLVSFVVAPKGPFNPVVTLTLTLTGLCIYLLYHKLFAKVKSTSVKAFLTVIITQTFFILPFNTLGIALYSTKSYWSLLAVRAYSLLFYIPVFTIVLALLIPILNPVIARFKTSK